MFESLSDKLKKSLKNLRGQGKLTPEHVDIALREIRMALLEADVKDAASRYKWLEIVY